MKNEGAKQARNKANKEKRPRSNPQDSARYKVRLCAKKCKKACCDRYGCVSPCPSQMDAVGCWIRPSRSLSHDLRAIPSKLYRILRPLENAARIVAKDPSATKSVLSHVNCGSRPNYVSQFISATASLDVAKRYRDKFQAKNNVKLRIGEFDTNELRRQGVQMIDLTTEAGRNQHLGRAVMAKNFAKASQEVVLKSAQRKGAREILGR